MDKDFLPIAQIKTVSTASISEVSTSASKSKRELIELAHQLLQQAEDKSDDGSEE